MKFNSATVLALAIGYLGVFTISCVAANDTAKKSLDQSVYDEKDRFLQENVFSSEEATTRYIIKFKNKQSMLQSQVELASDSTKSTLLMSMEAFDMEVVDIGSPEELEILMANEDVIFAEPDQERYLLNPKETAKYLRRQQESEEIPYGIDLVQALDVSDEFVENMKVCIIDTGYDINHEDLPKGSNVGGNNNRGSLWNEDGNGHGTHVAGTIAAIGDNNVGVVGVNRSGKIGLHIERLFANNGRPIFGSTLIGLANGCVEAGSNIISMSLGGARPMQAESDAFEKIYKENNVLVVAAAGNSGNNAYSYPASYDAVMSVAAIDEDSNVAYFSQKNDQVDIAAPGVDVLSTKTGGGYVAYSGTSMACPHVAGVAALVWSHFTDKTSEEIRAALTGSAEDLGDIGRDNSYGYGLVRADRAYALLSGVLTFSPTTAPTPQRPCFNSPEDFTDSRGNDCVWYEGGFFINRCSWFGGSRGNSDGVDANDACCFCGGGTYEPINQTPAPSDSPTTTSAPSASPTTSAPTTSPTKSPTSSPTTSPTSAPTLSKTESPTTSPTSAPTVCSDVEGWVDSRGTGCDRYGFFRCLFFGNSFENDGLTANDACCSCKF